MAAMYVGWACESGTERTISFEEELYPSRQLVSHEALKFGEGVDDQGQNVELLLDMWAPPYDGQLRPVVVMVHGGSFVGGDRFPLAFTAHEFAERGAVSVSIEYRLASEGNAQNLSTEGGLDAIGDGQLAVQWLRGNADQFDIDPDRIAALGRSAGGVVALGMATDVDHTEGRLDNGESFTVDAAVATGLHLGQWIEAGEFAAGDGQSPAMILHHDTDTATLDSFEEAEGTCVVFADVCETVRQDGPGHAALLHPEEQVTADHVLPFLEQVLSDEAA